MDSRKIEVGIFKVKATFTRQMVDDLEIYNGFDLNGDLEKSLIRELRRNSLNRVKEKIRKNNE